MPPARPPRRATWSPRRVARSSAAGVRAASTRRARRREELEPVAPSKSSGKPMIRPTPRGSPPRAPGRLAGPVGHDHPGAGVEEAEPHAHPGASEFPRRGGANRPGLVFRHGHAIGSGGVADEAWGGLAVKKAEVHRLGQLAVVSGHFVHRFSQHVCGGELVKVDARLVGVDHFPLTCDGCGGPQFDLRVVRHHETTTGGSDERLAQFAATDVLQVGFLG